MYYILYVAKLRFNMFGSIFKDEKLRERSSSMEISESFPEQ